MTRKVLLYGARGLAIYLRRNARVRGGGLLRPTELRTQHDSALCSHCTQVCERTLNGKRWDYQNPTADGTSTPDLEAQKRHGQYLNG